jgi:hypothetical protein
LREQQNVKNRFKAIDANWTPEHIKTDVTAQTILFEFCSYYNDFSIVYEKIGEEMITAMEELSDGIYPEALFGELVRDCDYSINGDGERYHVLKCAKTNKGYRCQIEIVQSINLRNYTRAYAVHYDEISLRGYLDTDVFVKTPDVQELKYLECSNEYSGDYAVCMEKEVPEPCKSMLSKDDIRGVISNCNFTMEKPPVGIAIPNGGILIQGEKLAISNGENSISQKPPIVIYSPEVLTIKSEEEDYVFPPAIHIEELIVIESKLSKDDIQALHDSYHWEKIWEHLEVDDYIRYTLILLQLILFPIALSGCYFTLKQRHVIAKLSEKEVKRKGAENFKNNQQMLRKI